MPGLAIAASMKQDMEAKFKAEGQARNTATFIRTAPAPTMKHEDLGANVIEGVSATGTRETNTIEAGAMGNDRPITITSERWMSPDLQIEIKSIHNDPRMGQTTHSVTNINRAEPDTSLFQVPSDYKIDDGKAGGQIQRYEFHSEK